MVNVVVTGASGNLGGKLRAHFATLGWTVNGLDTAPAPGVQAADLAVWDSSWVDAMRDADAVVHLAGDPGPRASWRSVQHLNLDLTMNVYEAAARGGAKRLVFASSNWVVAGHRFGTEPLTADTEAYPVNPYGVSKLVGERLGRSYSDRWGLPVVCFRIGYCQRGDNQPGAHMGWGAWGQRMWLSNRDLCQGFEKAVTAPATLRFAVLNLVSRNEGMRWDVEAARQAIGYRPMDGCTLQDEAATAAGTDSARQARRLVEAAEAWVQDQRW